MSSMSSSDPKSDPKQEPFTSSTQPTYTPTTRRGRQRKWGALMGLAALVVALAIGLLAHAGMFAANRPASSVATSARVQTYHDPFDLYTLQLPSAWTAEVVTSTTGIDEMIAFDDPTQGKGSAQVAITVNPISTEIERQYICRTFPVRLDFSGLSLSKVEQWSAQSVFDTENASFQIDVTIPGVLAPVGFGPATPTPTPLPAAWLATDTSEVNAMLVSFHPSDPMPLKC